MEGIEKCNCGQLAYAPDGKCWTCYERGLHIRRPNPPGGKAPKAANVDGERDIDANGYYSNARDQFEDSR